MLVLLEIMGPVQTPFDWWPVWFGLAAFATMVVGVSLAIIRPQQSSWSGMMFWVVAPFVWGSLGTASQIMMEATQAKTDFYATKDRTVTGILEDCLTSMGISLIWSGMVSVTFVGVALLTPRRPELPEGNPLPSS